MPSPPSARLLDPKALMRIRSLELRARVVVEGFWSGIHRSPYHGFSAEFSEYRQYTPGDDVRHIDWRVYARSLTDQRGGVIAQLTGLLPTALRLTASKHW